MSRSTREFVSDYLERGVRKKVQKHRKNSETSWYESRDSFAQTEKQPDLNQLNSKISDKEQTSHSWNKSGLNKSI